MGRRKRDDAHDVTICRFNDAAAVKVLTLELIPSFVNVYSSLSAYCLPQYVSLQHAFDSTASAGTKFSLFTAVLVSMPSLRKR